MRGGVRANLDAAGGGTYLIFPLVKLILGPPLPDNYCTVPNALLQKVNTVYVRAMGGGPGNITVSQVGIVSNKFPD